MTAPNNTRWQIGQFPFRNLSDYRLNLLTSYILNVEIMPDEKIEQQINLKFL